MRFMLINDLNYLTRKKKETILIEGLIRDNYRINNSIHYADRLHNCTQNIAVHQRRLIPLYPCRVYGCPTCDYFKNRKSIAQFHEIYHRLEQQPKLNSAKFYLLTLTIRECPVSSLRDRLADMNAGYHQLLGKVDKSVISASRFLHIGINPDQYVHPHFHVVLIVKSGRSYIKQTVWHQYWSDVMNLDYQPHVHILPLNPHGPIQSADFVRAMRYGLKYLDMQQIKAHGATFAALFNVARGIRRVSHRGLIKNLKRAVVEEYQEHRLQRVDIPEPTQLMRFDGSQYCQARLILPDDQLNTPGQMENLPKMGAGVLVTD